MSDKFLTSYDNFAETFSNSRKNMKWEEIQYFLSFLSFPFPGLEERSIKILDVGCGNGRLLKALNENGIKYSHYLGIDSSKELLNEARKFYPKNKFENIDMRNIEVLEEKFDVIFFVASFHHLKNINEGLEVLKKAYNLLEKNGKIFMTNWNLKGDLNFEKYKASQIKNSQNEFGSVDYNIKIGNYTRFYHSFSIEELNYLFQEAGFKIIENREFGEGKNIISILEK